MNKEEEIMELKEIIAGAKAKEELLLDYIDNIASIIYYQMSCKEQDLWVDDVVAMGWYEKPEEEDGSE